MARCYTKKLGIGLLELMLTIVLIIAIITMLGRYYVNTRESARVSKAVDILNNLVSASYQWVAGNTNFTGISLNALQTDKFLPTNYGSVNPWQGTITIQSVSGNLQIIMTNIPTKSCAILKTTMSRYSKNTDSSCSGTATTQSFTIDFMAP